jgi:hypothetical protein
MHKTPILNQYRHTFKKKKKIENKNKNKEKIKKKGNLNIGCHDLYSVPIRGPPTRQRGLGYIHEADGVS